ncbi:MAG: hypothetical protein ACXWNC_02705 [Anaerolineales bacterium]
MLKDTNKVDRNQVLEEAKAWWGKLTEIEKNAQMIKGKLIDTDESRRVGRSRLKGWDQVDLEQYSQRILGK